MEETWGEALRTARQGLGLSRADLATLSGLSAESVRAYEQQRRRPTLRALVTLTDALLIDRVSANHIRLALGYAPDLRDLHVPGAGGQYTAEELPAVVADFPWPSFVVNEFMEVIAANRAAERVWDVDLAREFLNLPDRSLVRVATDKRFADRCSNWDEVVGTLIAIWKGIHMESMTSEQPNPKMERVLDGVIGGDPVYVRRLLHLWQDCEPTVPRVRAHYRVVWNDPRVGQITFLGMLSPANMLEALGWNDWIPLDALNWERFSRLMEG